MVIQRTFIEWHWIDETFILDGMLFDGSFVPNFVHRSNNAHRWLSAIINGKRNKLIESEIWNQKRRKSMKKYVLWLRVSHIVVDWLLKVHPSNETAMCCQECYRYTESLIKLIPINRIAFCYWNALTQSIRA